MKKKMIALMGVAVAGLAGAADISVTNDIVTSTTWTSDNVYDLQQQIYVRPGATLTIEAGTLVQSESGVGGSLAVCRGAKIYVNGTANNPVIMTSSDDDLVNWHEGCNEWGNLTIMGKGLVAASSDSERTRSGNTKTPTGLNVVQMEGLTAASTNAADVAAVSYGGNDDDDDSGALHYLSLRYGGKVIGLANELNGLSMGGVGRGTDVDHIEIMNNVDDGIETWGGAVNYKYISIWNVGDDSMDIDQGWRGKAQFGLIVQGYSTDAGQGSGLGDNCLEIDGAEDSDAQPATTTKIANFTVIGNPYSGDGGTTWRDNARVQYHNCLFLDIGEELIRLDGNDGDGAQGYNYALGGVATNGVGDIPAFSSLWASSYTNYPTMNWSDDVYATAAEMYPVQTSGYLCEMTGCAMNYVNENDGDDLALALGIVNGSAGAWESNTNLDNIVTTDNVIASFERGPVVTRGGKSVALVTNINPCAVGVATSVEAPEVADGFFVAANYRGAFPADNNWLAGWTAVDAYGMTDTSMNEESAVVDVLADITTSTTWTSDKVYNLMKQVYVREGATLTIDAGTLIQSQSGVGGSLAVCRGAKIYVNGTEENPVIMTSTDDDLVNWHEGCNEWGNLTIMGKGLVAASSDSSRTRDGNTKTPTGLNVVQMEGLTAASTNAADVATVSYGGNDDDDDSGALHYLSLRYGGKVIGLANELNGLSMGGVGRGTDVDHIEIMNNVDDGIETWGGAVNYKYISIWNVGDDSMDIDQGWRGKAQFGLIVQGYSTDASQGSGLGDNCLEIDGAEDSDAQPATTTKIANFTVIGNPYSGDGGTTWRDNARVQYHNCLFLDIGEELIRLDGNDGDGAQGYNYAINGVYAAKGSVAEIAAFTNLWSASYDSYPVANWDSSVYATAAEMYPVQTSGFLCEMTGCAMNYVNENDGDDLALALGIVNGSAGAWTSNTNLDNIVTTDDVIAGFDRGPVVTRGGKSVALVTNINPCAVGVATSVETPEVADGFFVAADYRGAFSADYNWLANWTAVDAYGMTDTSMNPLPAPTASIVTGVGISFESEDGVTYSIQVADTLEGPWAEVESVVGDGSTQVIWDVVDLDAGFYRVVVE